MSSFQGTKINPTRFDKSQIKFYVILIIMSAVMVLPLIYIFSQAFKPIDELFAYPPKFFVRNPSLSNFSNLLAMMGTSEVPIARYFFNSIVITVLTIVFSLTISAMAGYALAKKKFRSKDFVFDMNTMALMFVPTAVMIPKYLIISGMQLYTSFWVHIEHEVLGAEFLLGQCVTCHSADGQREHDGQHGADDAVEEIPGNGNFGSAHHGDQVGEVGERGVLDEELGGICEQLVDGLEGLAEDIDQRQHHHGGHDDQDHVELDLAFVKPGGVDFCSLKRHVRFLPS